jgi:RNA recognition motif-containing protein
MKLFVGGFPLDISEIELVKIFNLHGTVSTIKIVRDKKTRQCKGYAFLEMTDQAGADRSIEALDGTPMGDRFLSVKQTEDKPAAPPKPKAYTKPWARNTEHSYVKVERSNSSVPDKKKRPRKPL